MSERLVQENTLGPEGCLRAFGILVLLAATLIRVMGESGGLLESYCVCAAAQVLVVYCHYHVSSGNRTFRRSFRVYVSGITALACGILVSQSGLRSRSFDWMSCLVFGALGGAMTYLLAMIVGALADLSFNRVRRFLQPNECRGCGYDLTGNASGVCPECGAAIGPYERYWLSRRQ